MKIANFTFEKSAPTSTAEVREHESPIGAKRIIEVPSVYQMKIDYAGRTDSNPVYIGYNSRGAATSDTDWVLQKFTYDGSDRATSRTIAYDSWDNRTTTSYA